MKCPSCESNWNQVECEACGFKPPTREEMIATLEPIEDHRRHPVAVDRIMMHSDFSDTGVRIPQHWVGQLCSQANAVFRDLAPKEPLLAIDMYKDLVAAGDVVMIYDQIKALVVMVTPARDLIVEIDSKRYLCLSYHANVDRVRHL